MFKRVVFLISLAALASAAMLPLHPRAEQTSRLSDVGLILENVAIILPDESMMSEMQAAATELYMAAGQSNYLDIANRTLESYLSSFKANNNPESVSAWASMLRTIRNHRSKSNYTMMLKYSTTILSLAALAHAGIVPLHPRAEAVVAPDNLGLILNNVAAAIPDEKMGSELEAAAASLIGAAGQSNYDEMANSFLDSYLSSLEANNDPAHAQEMASELVTIVQFAGDIPAEVAAPYSSFLSALQNSEIATNDADIVNEIIKLASEIYLITPELFGDNPTATGTDAAESDQETGSASASDGSEPDAQPTGKEDLPSLDKDISLSDDESEHTESESKSSDASTVKHWTSGIALAGLAVSVIASLY
ncbi:hypothetical protein GGF39_002505 [Coemansia sp. RSA 1721]|nr:hypothetical protein GGF39_002505 [Coemansia sp. RSA 1721]